MTMCTACASCNGREAWDKAQRKQFDMVVTDEQMPVMSGQDLWRKLRADERYATTPMIFLTARRDGLSEDLEKDENITALLEKPFRPEVIVRIIEKELMPTGA